MATIPTLKTQVDTVIRQETGPHSVTRDEVSDQFDAGFDELIERGIITVASTAAMSALNSNDTKKVLVVGNGLFHYTVTGPADGVDTFAEAGGGFYTRSFSVGGGGSKWSANVGLDTIRPTNSENILLGTGTDAEAKTHYRVPAGVFEYLEPNNYLTDYEVLQAGLGIAQRFIRGYGRFDFPDNDGSPRPNVVYVEGYNTAPAGGRESTDDAGFGFRWETHFSGWFEFHLPEVYAKNGTWYRLMSFYVDKTTGSNNAELYANAWQWRSYVDPLNVGVEINAVGARIALKHSVDYSSTPRYATENFTSYFIMAHGFESLNMRISDKVTDLVDGYFMRYTANHHKFFGKGGAYTGSHAYFENMMHLVKGATLIGEGIADSDSPVASASLELRSTAKGFLPNRMTGAQAEAIAAPAEGLMVYATDGSGVTILVKGWWGWDGAIWKPLG